MLWVYIVALDSSLDLDLDWLLPKWFFWAFKGMYYFRLFYTSFFMCLKARLSLSILTFLYWVHSLDMVVLYIQKCTYLSAVAPTIKEGPQVMSVHINMPVVLECIVSGVPAPRVTWRKHGSILAGNNPRFAVFFRAGVSNLSSKTVGCLTLYQSSTRHTWFNLCSQLVLVFSGYSGVASSWSE